MLIQDVLSARSLGLPKLSIMKNWSLVFLNTYLIFSLNFIGIFGQETPPRIQVRNYALKLSWPSN